MDYQQKYLKYKQKYLELKKKIGGAHCRREDQDLVNFWKELGTHIQNIVPHLNPGFQTKINISNNTCNLYIWFENSPENTHIDIYSKKPMGIGYSVKYKNRHLNNSTLLKKRTESDEEFEYRVAEQISIELQNLFDHHKIYK
jgi:hypothetical protein